MSKTGDELRAFRTTIGKSTAAVLQFFSSNFGMHRPGTVLSSEESLRVRHNLQSITMATIVGLGAFYYILVSVRQTLDALFEGADPLPDLEDFLDALWLRRWAAYGVAIAGAMLMLWTAAIIRRFRLNPLFLIVPLTLAAVPWFFDPLVGATYRKELKGLYRHGAQIANFNKTDSHDRLQEAYSYFTSIKTLTENTLVGDNVLGGIAGAQYWLGQYDEAALQYAEILSRYPNSDIRTNVRISLEWSLNKFGESADADRIAELYERLAPRPDGLSVFRSVLPAPVQAERIPWTEFASISGQRRIVLSELLALYPNDPWSPRAAFLIGDAEMLRTRYGESPWGTAYLVLDGIELQRLQRFEDAADRYRRYLLAHPKDANSDRVRSYLAACYLRDDDLKRAMSQTIELAGFPHEISPRIDHRLLQRFAFDPDLESMFTAYEQFHRRVPVSLAIDMAEILAERLELERDPRARQIRRTSRIVLRDADPTRNARDRDGGQRVGEYIVARFRYEPVADLVSFINCRVTETRRDVRRFHYLDRFYGMVHAQDSGVGEAIYTRLLKQYAYEGLERLFAVRPSPSERLELLSVMHSELRDPGVLDDAINQIVAEADREPGSLSISDVHLLIRVADYDACGEALHRILDGHLLRVLTTPVLPHEEDRVVASAIDLLEALPSTSSAQLVATGVWLRVLASPEPRGTAAERTAWVLEQKLRQIVGRDATEPTLIQLLHDLQMQAVRAENTYPRRRALLDTAVFCLRRPALYQQAAKYFEEFIHAFGDDPFRENCHSWLGWLACYDAFQGRAVLRQCIAHYDAAARHYEWIVANGHQPRVVLNARRSLHLVNRHRDLIASGEVRPVHLPIPEEFHYWQVASPTKDPATDQRLDIPLPEPLRARIISPIRAD